MDKERKLDGDEIQLLSLYSHEGIRHSVGIWNGTNGVSSNKSECGLWHYLIPDTDT